MQPGLIPTAGIPCVLVVRPVRVTGNPGVVPTGVLVLMRAVHAQQAQRILREVSELHLFMMKIQDRVVLNVTNHTYSNHEDYNG